jgi:hypothetical protein
VNLNLVGIFRRLWAQHIVQITGRVIASTAPVENAVLNPVGRPSDPGANFKSGTIQTVPMMRVANDILKDQGCSSTDPNNHIDALVIIRVFNGISRAECDF